MNAEQIIDTIAAQGGIDAKSAESAAGTILSVIQQELDPAISAQLFQKLPGAAELASAFQVNAGGGGLLGSLASAVMGARGAILAAGFSQLQSSGLSMSQIEQAAMHVLEYVRANAGAGFVKHVTDAVPGLPKP